MLCVYAAMTDILFLYRNQLFAWNREKAAANFIKHGVRFEKACEVFFDPLFLVEDASGVGERREAIIGAVEEGGLLYVIHLVHQDDTIRLISARATTAHERSRYEQGD